MSSLASAHSINPRGELGELAHVLDSRTLEILRRRGDAAAHAAHGRRRGSIVRGALVLADLVGLSLAFVAALVLANSGGDDGLVGRGTEFLVFVLTLPGWILLAKILGLYERDEERADHSTADEFVAVLHHVTLGAWLFVIGAKVTGAADPSLLKLAMFWLLAVLLLPAARACARAACRRSVDYVQNAIVVGAGDVGQLVARKLLQHPEYAINLVGFVDAEPKQRRSGLEHLALLGPPERLPEFVSLLDVERVIVAFSNDADVRTLEVVRSLRDLDVQIDVVPRLFDLVGPNVEVHMIEALPLVGLRRARPSRSSRALKRAVDIAVAALALVATAPLFALIAWKIRRDSPGPVFFRQTRLGMGRREFTALKFRTMYVDTDDAEHRTYIKETMSAKAALGSNGMYKLDRSSAVTPVGRWLRKTSLDELPQLINVLRGDMSLVGPRPCIPYETENFEPHHFERFLVPAGVTGLWQVMARAHATFGEALGMDVSYARGWSFGLDLRLLLRTPIALLRQRARGTA